MGDERRAGRVLVLGLGNTILRDDGAGVHAAREASRLLGDAAGPGGPVEVKEAALSGLALLEVLAGYEAAVICDAVELEGVPSGEVREFELGELLAASGRGPVPRLMSVHDVDLGTALELGRRLGMELPHTVLVVGIRVQDAWTFGEDMTPAVAAAVPRAAARAAEAALRMARGVGRADRAGDATT